MFLMNRLLIAISLVLTLFSGLSYANLDLSPAIGSTQWREAELIEAATFPEAELFIRSVAPTFLFQRGHDGLLQLAVFHLENVFPEPVSGTVEISLAETVLREHFRFDTGLNDIVIHVPDVRDSAVLSIRVYRDERLQQKASFQWEPTRHWKAYVVQTSHFDLGYTDGRDTIMLKRDEILDLVLDLCTVTDDWPDESRFRWIVEASYTLSHYLETHPEREQELKARIDQGRIEISAKLAHTHSSTAGHEEIIRNLYESTINLSTRLGGQIVTAVHSDVDGITWGSVTAWVGAGIRYFSFNPNYFFRGGNILHDTDTPQAYYWIGPTGDKVLTWRSRWAYGEAAFLLDGLPATEDQFPRLLQSYENAGYPYDAIHLTRTGHEMWGSLPVADNSIPHIEVCDTARLWNELYEYPKLICATSSQFFQYLEENFADQIPEIRGDCPDWWADGVLTGALAEAEVRRVHHLLAEAETLASIASIIDADFSYPARELREAWVNTLLFNEHTWGYIFPFLPKHWAIWNEKVTGMENAGAACESIKSEALRTIASKIETVGPSLLVFNALSWDRTDLVAWRPPDQFPDEFLGTRSFRILDFAGEQVPWQEGLSPEDASTVYFIAGNVPAQGYAVYRIVPSDQKPDFAGGFSSTDSGLENERYRIKFDPNQGITGIADLDLERDLVDEDAPYRVNEFISRAQGLFDIRDQRNTGIVVDSSLNATGPVFASLVFKTRDPDNQASTITQVTRLYNGLNRIDFVNRVDGFFNFLGQSRYFAFPFDVSNFEFRMDVPLAVMEPFYEQLPDFAKYYAVGHWIDVSSRTEDFGVAWATVEGPMVELGEITKKASWANFGSPVNMEYDPGEYPYEPRFPHIYSEIMNNFQNTNFNYLQWGDGTWRYSIAGHEGGWDQPEVARFGWVLSSPLIPMFLEESSTGALPESMSFFRVSEENVKILAIKRAEQENGYLVRLFENEGKPTEVILEIPMLTNLEATLADNVERPISALSIGDDSILLTLDPFSLASVLVTGDPAGPAEDSDDDDTSDASWPDDYDDEHDRCGC